MRVLRIVIFLFVSLSAPASAALPCASILSLFKGESQPKETPEVLIAKLLGGLELILEEFRDGLWGQHQEPFSKIMFKTGTDWMGHHPDEVSATQRRIDRLAWAFDQVYQSLDQLSRTSLSQDQTKRTFAIVLDRILLSESFLLVLRFLEGQRRFSEEEVWSSWDDLISKLSKALAKRLPRESKEEIWAQTVLSAIGQANTIFSLQTARVMLRVKSVSDQDPHLKHWINSRAQHKRSASALLQLWNNPEGQLKPIPVQEALAEPTRHNSSRVNSDIDDLTDHLTMEAIDSLAERGGDVRPRKDSGIRKPGANRPPELVYKLSTPAERAKIDRQKRDAKLKAALEKNGTVYKRKPQ